jgi:hypothetical protein
MNMPRRDARSAKDLRHFDDRKTPMRSHSICLAIAVTLLVAACEHKPSKEEEEAAKNTITCMLAGERLVIRFDSGEARMLTSSAERITLYQIGSAGGMRYSNGNVELRGKGMDWSLSELGVSTTLEACKQYTVPKP